jgi:glutamate---cysteine ligase / carboxylate-amine ligase
VTGQVEDTAPAGASVLEHRFGSSVAYTLGVEEEYMLLDPETWDLVQHVDSVLAAAAEGEFRSRIYPELMQSVIEITTPVCSSAAEVELQLRRLRHYLGETAAGEGCRFASAGTHPFSLFERQRITAKDRYRLLVDQLQYIARRELIFGMHIHAAVEDPEKAVQVANGLIVHLPEFLALSANSPFWRGEPTGLSSSRQMVFSAFPRSGVPPRFESYEAFAEVVGHLERTGCIADYTHIWWDIRPHPRLGTVELRICDAVTRLEDVVALAAYYQSLVKLLCEHVESVGTAPSFHRILTTENKWLAARHGLSAPVMDLVTGRRNRVPVAQLVRRTLRDLQAHARELGCERELEGVSEILARGNGAEAQLRVWNANRDIVEVVAELASATEVEAPPADTR